MARPKGFDHFCNFLQGLEESYVIIGGGAAAILLDETGVDFRSTKDVDLVILTRSEDLNERILKYIEENKYQVREATQGSPKYYRFQKPGNIDSPAIIELFCSNDVKLDLKDGQYIVPINLDLEKRLSAILIDEEYFSIIKNNIVKSGSGIPLINIVANICMKARAHRELKSRKENGDESIDGKDIQKHLNDILRLAAGLTGTEKALLEGQPREDLEIAVDLLSYYSKAQFRDVTKATPGLELKPVLDTIKKVFF